MITGIDIGLTQDYISKFDSSEPKTVWKIGVLSAHAFAYIGAKLSDSSKSVEGMIEIVRFGLRGFENFKGKDGKDIEFKTQDKDVFSNSFKIVASDIINNIPVDIIIELGGKILEITKLSESQIKN